jgi:hypothetical protein
MTTHNGFFAALAIAALGATACGGSSGGGGGGGGGGTVTVNAMSKGAIRIADDSVRVNGVTWQVAGATLRIDDSEARQVGSGAELRNGLDDGMVVEVRGQLDDNGRTGRASEIRFGEDFQGPVTAVAADGSGFTVLGIQVIVDASTAFVNSAGAARALSDVAVGTRVEVSGTPDAGGSFRATHVKIEDSPGDASGELEAKGFVVNATATTFQLALTPGGAPFLTVNAGSFAVPAAGAFVEVKGAAVTPGTPPSITLARAVEVEDRFSGASGNRSEVEGIVVSGTLAEFVVGSTTVRTSGSTTYTGIPEESTAAEQFAIGVKVEAEGSFDAAGVLVASKVKFKDGARIGGVVSGPSGSLPGAGSFALLGLTVAHDAATRVEVEPGAALAGGSAEVRGYRRANGTIYAQEIRVREAGGGGGDRPFLQGLVEAAASPGLTIMGIQVTTSGASGDSGTEFQGEDEAPFVTANGTGPAAQAAFFAAVTPGRTIVKVKWDGQTSPVTEVVREAEIEAEDD